MRYTKLLTILTTVLLLLTIPSAAGQPAQSARSLGMADSYLLLSSNCEAALLNPANLALPGRTNYSIKLFSLSGRVNNNAFSLNDYNKYNGAYLTEADKQDILSKIPTDGLSLDFAGSASLLSFSVGSFAFTSEVIGGGYGVIAKDPIELVLMGNKMGELVTADGSDAAGWSAVAIGVSYGRNILNRNDLSLNAGASFKYLRGLAYFGIKDLSAEAVTLATGFAGEGGLTMLQSQGGSGYAVDLGLAATKGDTRYGLVIRNLLASINWNQQAEKTLYTFQFDNLTVDNAGEDTILVSDNQIIPINAFSSRPPLQIEVGAARHFGRFLATASYRQGFVNSAFVSRKPRLGVGAEYPATGFLALRSGLAIGGSESFSTSIGTGFSLGPVHLDLAYAAAARIVPWGGRGGQFAISTAFQF